MPRSYKFRWRDGEKHRQKSFPTRAHRDAFAAKIKLGQHDATPSHVLFRDFTERWLSDHARVMKAESTQRDDELTLRLHILPAFGHLRLTDIKRQHLIEFRSELLAKRRHGRGKKTLSPKTVNNIMAIARQMMSCAVEWELIPKNPFAKLPRVPVVKAPIDFWTVDERDKFLNFCRARDPEFAELVTVAIHTGLRRGELAALQRHQLDFKTRQIMVSATYSELLKKRIDRTKNRKVGFVPMTDEVFECLKDRQMMAPDAPVFKRELFVNINRKLRRRCKEGHVRPIHAHGLRHSFASHLVMAGVSLYTVQRLMRHESITMTERYSHLAPNYLHEEISKLCARNVRDGKGEKRNEAR